MNKDQIIWTMIQTLLATYYDSANIFLAFQNNMTLPVVNDFIIITRRNIGQVALPLRNFNVLLQQKILTAFGDWEYQVDLYGGNADVCGDILHTYVNSVSASNYLIDFGMGIGKVKDPLNLSAVNDRDRYMKRYAVIFTALNTTAVSIPMPGFGIDDVEITFKEFT
jgi:hypothetical protein